MSTRLIYITCENTEEAESIASALLQERLIACANIIERIQSMYWWKGEIQKDTETLLIAKTTEALVEKLIDTVTTIHSYECPCVVALPIDDGNPEFLSWIEKETN